MKPDDVTDEMVAAAWAVWDEVAARPYLPAQVLQFVAASMPPNERATAIAAMQAADLAAQERNDDLMRRVVGAAVGVAPAQRPPRAAQAGS